MAKFIRRHLDDLLLLAGCLAILYGISMWNTAATWIAGGFMAICLAVLVGMRNAAN